jgi:hypothetical protein
MTEEWWRQYKMNKSKSENKLFADVESELKRRFINEKSPQELYSICKTDNNHWKHYRASENLDPDSISLVLCKDYGCDLMYCQTLTVFEKGLNTLGCVDQFNVFRKCYVDVKEKFNSQYPQDVWMKDKTFISKYIERELQIKKQKEERERIYGEQTIEKPKFKYADFVLAGMSQTTKNSKNINDDDGYY